MSLTVTISPDGSQKIEGDAASVAEFVRLTAGRTVASSELIGQSFPADSFKVPDLPKGTKWAKLEGGSSSYPWLHVSEDGRYWSLETRQELRDNDRRLVSEAGDYTVYSCPESRSARVVIKEVY